MRFLTMRILASMPERRGLNPPPGLPGSARRRAIGGCRSSGAAFSFSFTQRPPRVGPTVRPMRTRPLAGLLLAAALLVLSAVPAAAASPPGPRQQAGNAAGGVAEIPISFQVHNVNGSKVSCASDGKTYTVRGHLVTPAGASTTKAVTLYLHGLGLGEFFWRFQDVPGYDYAATQARAGQSSVVIDRLGYDSSDKPPGKDICLGSQADIAHQMITALRGGNYQLGGGQSPTSFTQVVLAGHSFGGLIAQIEAYSFGDIDGLIVMSYADQTVSGLNVTLAGAWTTQCATTAGGHPTDATPNQGPDGYIPFGPPSMAREGFFNNVDPQVFAAAQPMFNSDPCGDSSSFIPAVAADTAHLGEVHVPTLLISGTADALFPPPAGQTQAAAFTGAQSVRLVSIPTSAHALTLERTHGQVETAVQQWLQELQSGRVPAGGELTAPLGAAATGAGGTADGRDTRLLYGGVAALTAAAALALAARRRRYHTSPHHTA